MESARTAAAYDKITQKRAGDLNSKDTPFRYFSNYIKKTLIQYALDNIKINSSRRNAIVLDLASGRGGDIGKWLHSQSPELSFTTAKLSRERLVKTSFLECYDVSEESIAEAQKRYKDMATGVECQCSFSVADCFSEEFLRQHLPKSEHYGHFDIVSIQFAFHYACGSLERIDVLLEAIAASLSPNGVFIATTVNPDVLSERVREGRMESRGLYSIKLYGEPAWEGTRLVTGTRYLFSLDGFVDCDEYVVPIDYVRERARHYGLEEVTKFSKPFRLFYEDFKKDSVKNKGLYLVRGEMDLAMLYRSLCFRKISA